MSGSTQSTGSNYITRAISSNDITMCFWAKINSWTKHGYDSVCSIENGLAGASFKGGGLQQDPSGPGTAHNEQGWWYSGSGPFNAETPVLINTLGVWYFFCIVWSGTSYIIYYGTETGALSSQSLTSIFSANQNTIVYLGSDSGGENADVSFRGARLWTAALNSTEVTTERNSQNFSAVRTTNLDSALLIPDGSNPNVASQGSNWVLTGTWATDASNPSFGSADSMFFGAGSTA